MRYSWLCAALVLAGCNSIYYVPDSMERNSVVFARRGGYGMRRSIKLAMQDRGYDVVVGKSVSVSSSDDGERSYERSSVPSNTKYAVHVFERAEKYRPSICMFNGFWWWNFNVSISDQDTGHEILTWRGRGCADSSIRKLNRTLDKMEKRN